MIKLINEFRELNINEAIIEALEKIINYQDMFAMTFIKFLRKIIAHIESDSKDISELEHFIDCVEEIGNPTMVAFLRMNLSRIL